MTIVSIIFGILSIICGMLCMFTPLTTFLATGHLISIMLALYAIVGIVNAIRKRAGVLEIILSALSIILCIVSLFMPGSALVFNSLMLALASAWILAHGIISIILAIQVRKTNHSWFLGLISGILGVILGVYSILHPQMLALSAGMLIGFHFIETGINMIVLGTVIDEAED